MMLQTAWRGLVWRDSLRCRDVVVVRERERGLAFARPSFEGFASSCGGGDGRE
ncbi:hypothetical protein AKJ09_09779 [Labilithrix luteola]|uniref:Uncharacterized protein n=1 Tax=Labilithrix luteola TaxID=1391654 RepID=A0A0K1QBF2_9BACT|nr:hypothetical protein AKJ09_09779 [Labilithrix luteola]